jgi:hypothetical protein
MIPIEHAGHVVVDHPTHVDLIDPESGRWQQFPTMRAAKWNATVYNRIRKGFGFREDKPKPN